MHLDSVGASVAFTAVTLEILHGCTKSSMILLDPTLSGGAKAPGRLHDGNDQN